MRRLRDALSPRQRPALAGLIFSAGRRRDPPEEAETAVIKILKGGAKTKARQKVPTSPALAEFLNELESVRNIHAQNSL